MCRVIGVARQEWNLHLPRNPASGELVARVELTEEDERDRRLQSDLQRGSVVPSRDRRKGEDEDFELDPEIDELLGIG